MDGGRLDDKIAEEENSRNEDEIVRNTPNEPIEEEVSEVIE